MNAPMLTLRLQSEPDIVAARQRARHIASELGFDPIEQTRLATAVSEIARNAYVYAGGGRVEFVLEGDSAPQVLMIRVIDSGKGIADVQKILSGEYRSPTGMGLGIAGARRLVDRFSIDSTPRGTTVTLARLLPSHVPVWRGADLRKLANSLARNAHHAPISSTVPSLPAGWRLMVRCLSAAGSGNDANHLSLPAVSTNPGATPTTRIFGPHSKARLRTRPVSAALVVL